MIQPTQFAKLLLCDAAFIGGLVSHCGNSLTHVHQFSSVVQTCTSLEGESPTNESREATEASGQSDENQSS